MKTLPPVILSVLVATTLGAFVLAVSKESFTEQLHLQHLPDGKVLAEFEFITTSYVSGKCTLKCYLRHPYMNSDYDNYNLFPRILSQVLDRYDVNEMHLTFTQGRWNYEKWGYPIQSSAPTGVELWAWLKKSDRYGTDATWKGFTNALSGLSCASLNYIDSSLSARPVLSFKATSNVTNQKFEVDLRHGSLPREGVCTENLTPWVKLLPCRSKAGIARLLNAYKLFDNSFYSMGVHSKECEVIQRRLKQTLAIVFDPAREAEKRDWSLSSLFSRPLQGSCPLASQSSVLVTLPQNTNEWTIKPTSFTEQRKDDTKTLAVYDLKTVNNDLDIGFSWKRDGKSIYLNSPPKPRVYVRRHSVGYGQERGGVIITFTNTSPNNVSVVYYDLIPWFLQLYIHTLKLSAKYLDAKNADSIFYYHSAIDRVRPSVIEMKLNLRSNSVTTMTFDYDMAFLRYAEHRPDANRGVDVGSAVVTVPLDYANDTIIPVSSRIQMNSDERPQEIYTDHFLVPLATPDFSMPYNVITFSCTVVGFFFGSMFNMITRRFVAVPSAQ
ncbi:GPI transamidase component PIG-T [Paraphysoderma sedebokerense]|nr:GPI transamidase component PIG-T [Paraphysoderma sedebokerense]